MTANGRLPPGWRRVKLGDVCEAVRGITFKSEQTTHRVTEGFIACITTSAVQDITDWDSRRYVPVSTVKNNSQLLKDGDVLVSTANSKALVGKSCLVSRIPEECAFGAFVTVLRTTQAALPEWISSAIRHDHAKQYFYTVSSNTTNISNLRTTDLLDFEIPLPPLEEQKRIVARLNEQMATAKKAKKAAEELLDAARALPNAFLREALPFEGQRLPYGWRWVAVRDLMPSTTHTVNPLKHPSEVFALYSIPAFEQGEPQLLSGRLIGSSKQHVQHRDVLLSKIVPHIRRSWIVGSHKERTIASTEWIVFRTTDALPEYLRFVLISDDFHHQLMNTVSGVGGSLLRARPSLVAEIRIPLPPLSEQKRIATMLLEQIAAAEETRRAANTALANLRAMPSALLRRALEGAF